MFCQPNIIRRYVYFYTSHIYYGHNEEEGTKIFDAPVDPWNKVGQVAHENIKKDPSRLECVCKRYSKNIIC